MTMLSAIRKAIEEDPIGGSILIDEIVYGYLSDQAEQLRPELEELTKQFVSERINIAKRALGRSYVESIAKGEYPAEDIAKSAKWLADIEAFIEVSKDDLTGADLYEFNRKHPRGAGGRFRQGLGVKTLNPKFPGSSRASNKLSPLIRDKVEDTGYPEETDDNYELFNQEQHQYELANRAVNSILRNFSGKSIDDINVIVNMTSGVDGKKYSIPYSAKSLRNNRGFNMSEDKLWNIGDTIDDFEIEPKREASDLARNQVAAYNILGGANNTLAALSQVNPESYHNLASAYNYGQSQKRGKLSNFFNRLGAGGDVLSQVPGLEKYGSYARFVGSLGPQAEDALGPYAQRAAYRYRGTEKEPDLELARQFNSKLMRAVEAAGESRTPLSDVSNSILRAANDPAHKQDVGLQAAAYEIRNLSRTRDGQFTPDELVFNVRSDIAAHHMLTTLPDDPFVAEVSAESGHVLPSQGVIIDADGHLISQSVGFSDDHYLPFDLKNLASLRGGQYIRTRQQGGLTGEDIYTSIRAGARMATVVSSSGVYSLEFDPNFRGARGNSDKARSMYDRYLKILDAIENSKLYVKDIDPAEKAQLRAQANLMGDNAEGDLYQRFLKERREASKTLDEGTIAILHEESVAQATSEGFKVQNERFNRRVEEIFDEKSQEKLKERVSQLSLNAKGYQVALRTLQQQFPYFIRNVSYQPLTSKQQGEGFLQNLNQSGALGARQKLNAQDKGYVNPGGLRPESMRQGFYNPSRQSYNKFKNEKFYGSTGSDEVVTDESEAKTSGSTVAASGTSPKNIKSEFLSNLELFAQGKKDLGPQAAKQLDMYIQSMPVSELAIGRAPNDPEGLNQSFEDAMNNPDKNIGRGTALKILLHIQGGGIYKEYQKHPSYVASLLSDKKLVNEVAPMYNNEELKLRGLPNDLSFEDFKKMILDAGKQMSLSASFAKPFESAKSGEAFDFYTGDTPQSFDDLSMLSDEKSISRLLNIPQNRAIANVFNEFSAFDSDTEASAEISNYIKILQNARDASANSVAEAKRNPKALDYSPEKVLRTAGISQADWDKAIGNLNDLRAGGYSEARPMTMFDPNVIALRASNLQKGRALAQAQRLMREMAGDETPKAPTPSAGGVTKSQQVRSSRQVQVLSKSHPLSLEMQRRRRLNLPLVSKK